MSKEIPADDIMLICRDVLEIVQTIVKLVNENKDEQSK